jgi:hypothetical protein
MGNFLSEFTIVLAVGNTFIVRITEKNMMLEWNILPLQTTHTDQAPSPT